MLDNHYSSMFRRLKQAGRYLLYRSFRGIEKASNRLGLGGFTRWIRHHPSWLIVLGIAIGSDVLDYLGGAIPVVGDVLDVATTVVLTPLIGPQRGAVTLIELVPGADFLPTFTVMALYAMIQQYRGGRRRRTTH